MKIIWLYISSRYFRQLLKSRRILQKSQERTWDAIYRVQQVLHSNPSPGPADEERLKTALHKLSTDIQDMTSKIDTLTKEIEALTGRSCMDK